LSLIRGTNGDPLASVDMMQADAVEVSDATMEQGVRLFSALSSEDAVRLFLYAEKGITSSTQAMKELGLTQKRYYSRLKGLIDVDLIEKVEGGYRYTALGKVVHRLGLYLIGVLDNKERIKLIHSLSKAKSLSPAERKKVEKMISAQSGDVGGLLNSVLSGKTCNKVKEIITYEELVEKLVEHINLSKNNLLIASKYIDTRVINTMLKAFNRGVTFKAIMSKGNLDGKLNKLRLLLSPKLLMGLLEFLGAPISLEDTFRELDIPFSFCIIDDQYCFFELPSLMESEFSIAFFLVDKGTSERFTRFFHQLWEKGETNAMLKFFQKLK